MNGKKFAIINSKLTIISIGDSNGNSPLYDIVFVRYTLSEDLKMIEGDTLDYFFRMSWGDISLDLLDESEIISRKFLWWSWKTCKRGWVLLKKRKFLKIKNPSGFIVVGDE